MNNKSIMISKLKSLSNIYLEVGGIVGLLKTIRFNFMYLSFNEAVHLPVFIDREIKVISCKRSCFVFNCSKLRPGIIGFGTHSKRFFQHHKSLISLNGKIIVNGDGFHKFGTGVTLHLGTNGILEIGNNFTIAQDSFWSVSKQVSFGDNCMLSYQLIIMDNDTHKVFNYYTGEQLNGLKEVIVGNNVWIGSRCTLLKGSKIPSNTIIGSNSLINSKLENEGGKENQAFLPAILPKYLNTKKYGIKRIYREFRQSV